MMYENSKMYLMNRIGEFQLNPERHTIIIARKIIKEIVTLTK